MLRELLWCTWGSNVEIIRSGSEHVITEGKCRVVQKPKIFSLAVPGDLHPADSFVASEWIVASWGVRRGALLRVYAYTLFEEPEWKRVRRRLKVIRDHLMVKGMGQYIGVVSSYNSNRVEGVELRIWHAHVIKDAVQHETLRNSSPYTLRGNVFLEICLDELRQIL